MQRSFYHDLVRNLSVQTTGRFTVDGVSGLEKQRDQIVVDDLKRKNSCGMVVDDL